MRKAFSLIELILVMVILGIIASVGSDIIRSLYDNYAATAKVQNLEMQANNIADIIANRLEHRIEQTTAVQNENNYAAIASTDAADTKGSLIFYRRAYELERNFATFKVSNGAYDTARYSGFISAISTSTTDSGDDDARTFRDEIVIENLESNGIDLSAYEVFFNDDNGLFYRNKSNPFERYYSTTARPFAYQCGTASFSYEQSSGKITLNRDACQASAADIIRPSMARLIHKIYLSNEINRIRLDETEKKLYLDICHPVSDKTCQNAQSSLLADNVNTFRFTAISSDENVATGVVFKLCLEAGDPNDGGSQACQTRIVR